MLNGMFILNVAETFKARHFHSLDGEKHSHTWRVNVTCASTQLEAGVVVSRSSIKDEITSLEGTTLNLPIMPFPSTEVLAAFICTELKEKGIEVKQVAVCEVDEDLPIDRQSWAVFMPAPPQRPQVTGGRGIHPDLKRSGG